jgi:23S rRNA (guanine745-N1)-methyltransferase
MSENPSTRSRGAVFACPVCGEPLNWMEQTFRCAAGHAFDIAKEGYVNLLAPQHRRSKDPGYSKQMIAGRRDFFDAGHYRPLADNVAAYIAGYLPTSSERLVVDAGCGEGYYLRRLGAMLAAIGAEDGTVLCGLDISKHGIRIAAKRDPTGLYAVAGTFHLPLMPASVDVLLTHFSPVSAANFRRVVRPGGVVLIGGPGENHLFGLKQLLYDTPALHEPTDALSGEPGFEPLATHRIRHKLALRGPGQVANLLLMTPYYWSEDPATHDRLASLEVMDTEIDVLLHAFRRTLTASESKLGPDHCGL